MLRAVAKGLGVALAVLGVALAVWGVPGGVRGPIVAAWLVVVGAAVFLAGVWMRLAWLGWLGLGLVAVYAVVLQPEQALLVLPFLVLLALALVLLATRPPDLRGAPQHR